MQNQSNEKKREVRPRMQETKATLEYRAYNDALSAKLKTEPAWKPRRRSR